MECFGVKKREKRGKRKKKDAFGVPFFDCITAYLGAYPNTILVTYPFFSYALARKTYCGMTSAFPSGSVALISV